MICGCCGSEEEVRKIGLEDKNKNVFKTINLCKVCESDLRGGRF